MNWDEKISKYFTWHDACLLRSWNIYHIPNEGEKTNIIKTAKIMDEIIDFLGCKRVFTHCWIRPRETICEETKYSGEDYNSFVGGAPSSGHINALAVDFSVFDFETTEQCGEIRTKLIPILEKLNIRMENITGNWVHIDLLPVKINRFFKP